MKRLAVVFGVLLTFGALFFIAQAEARPPQMTGPVSGSFSGTYSGSVSGSWGGDPFGDVSFSCTAATEGLSIFIYGSYNRDTGSIDADWEISGSEAPEDLKLSISGTNPPSFSGTITGSVPGDKDSQTPFTVNVKISIGSQLMDDVDEAGRIHGTFSGTAKGVASTPMGATPFSEPVTGTWQGSFNARLSDLSGTVSGSFSGSFSGSCQVTVDTGPLGGEQSMTLPVGGSFGGTIYRVGDDIRYVGSWAETSQTGGTSGTVYEGYGGPFELHIQGSAFPLSVSGSAGGGGSYTGSYFGQAVDVNYTFSGSYTGVAESE